MEATKKRMIIMKKKKKLTKIMKVVKVKKSLNNKLKLIKNLYKINKKNKEKVRILALKYWKVKELFVLNVINLSIKNLV